MQFKYKFSAVRGIQAGNEYYISMVPLKILAKLFPDDEEVILPEYRAQRKINEVRIPEIKNYILTNQNSYVFSALSASIDGEFSFKSLSNSDAGFLEINMDSIFLINDGQHRKTAIIEALEEKPEIGDETISIVFFRDRGLKRSQQMFTDLNKHAVKTSNSLATLYDSRDELAKATKMVIDKNVFLKKYTDKERDILGKNSSKLFTLNTIYKANKRILRNSQCNEDDISFLIDYWKTVTDNISEWNELIRKEISKKELKENYIVTLSITIQAFGKLGRLFYENQDISYKQKLTKLSEIDWSRDNNQWIGIAIRDNGKVLNGEESINLIYKKIEDLIGLNS